MQEDAPANGKPKKKRGCSWGCLLSVVLLLALGYVGSLYLFVWPHRCPGITDHPIELSQAYGTFLIQYPEGETQLYDIKPDQTYTLRVFASLNDWLQGGRAAYESEPEHWNVEPDCPSDRAPLFLQLDNSRDIDRKTHRPEEGEPRTSGVMVNEEVDGEVRLILDYHPDGTWDHDGGFWATKVTPRAGGGYEGLEKVKQATERMRRAAR